MSTKKPARKVKLIRGKKVFFAPEGSHPRHVAGMFKDDPTFDEFLVKAPNRRTTMFDWLKILLGKRSHRVAEPWETPQEIREKLWCVPRGIDPALIKNSRNGDKSQPNIGSSDKHTGIQSVDGSEAIRESAD
jgi:hypothetical protein